MILASASPRRSDILQQMGVSFVQVSPDTEELAESPEGPGGVVRDNALLKARAVCHDYPGQWVLAADTIVVIDGDILGKPKDMQTAWQMLSRLSGRQHEVYTGYALCQSDRVDSPICGVVVSKVTFRNLDLQAIKDYCELVDPLDKAGAYGIQQEKERIIASLEGSLTNVMGLPSEELEPHLREIGIPVSANSGSPA